MYCCILNTPEMQCLNENNALLLSHTILWFGWTQWGSFHMWLLSGRSQRWNHLEESLLTLSVPHLECLGAGQASLSALGFSAWLHCSYQHGGLSIIRPLTWWLASRRLEQVFRETRSATCQFITCWAQKPAGYCSYFFLSGWKQSEKSPKEDMESSPVYMNGGCTASKWTSGTWSQVYLMPKSIHNGRSSLVLLHNIPTCPTPQHFPVISYC